MELVLGIKVVALVISQFKHVKRRNDDDGPLDSGLKTDSAIETDSHRFLSLTLQGVSTVKLQNSGKYETCTAR